MAPAVVHYRDVKDGAMVAACTGEPMGRRARSSRWATEATCPACLDVIAARVEAGDYR